MKVMVVVGTRPEVIKMAPVVMALREAKINTIVCATGQHREMLAQALEVFSIEPEILLDVMSHGQSLNGLSARLLMELDRVLDQEKPDWVLVQGDTTTAFCGSLAAFHRGIKIGHVEAGLRTGDLNSPFPEEGNRSLIARLATRHFAPTNLAKKALLAEGIQAESITISGNTVVDAIHLIQGSYTEISLSKNGLAYLNLPSDIPIVLVTCHRRENFGEVLEGICHLLKRLCSKYKDFHWVFPVHLNPRVQEPVKKILNNVANLSLIAPVNYHTNLDLISRASLIVSDSGGIQEEAPTFGVPVVVMRSHTERQEGVTAGFATLAGQAIESIEAAVTAWLDNPEKRNQLKHRTNPYGDGLASKRIIATITGEMREEFSG